MFLYYSNYCNKCKELLNFLYKTPFRDQFKYICIDNRRNNNGQIVILLNNGYEIPLPPQIKSVPSLLNNENGQIFVGEEIKSFLMPPEKKIQRQNQEINNDPDAFTFGMNSAPLSGVVSDTYSFLSQSEDELKASGNGGLSQLYNYVTLNNYDNIRINTVEEDDSNKSNKIGNISLESLEQQRNNDIQNIQQNQQRTVI